MPSYKKNHEVPRSLISNWGTPGDKLRRVWVFDIVRQKVYHSAGTGSSPYKFAIVPNRYVATKLGRRRDDVELWLSRGENAVARFLRRLDNDELVSLDFEEAAALLYGLIGLGFRSAHVIHAWCAALRGRATQDALGLRPDTEDDITRLALENLVNLVSLRVQAVTPPYFEIVRALWSDVVLVDQVALVAPGNAGELYVPLSPRTVVCIRRTVGRSYFEVIDADRKHSPDLVKTLNDLLIKSARRWLVATTRHQLEERAAELSKTAVQRRVNENKFVGITPLPEGASWWALR
jgi:Protein of unknown function (DUF4238)